MGRASYRCVGPSGRRAVDRRHVTRSSSDRPDLAGEDPARLLAVGLDRKPGSSRQSVWPRTKRSPRDIWAMIADPSITRRSRRRLRPVRPRPGQVPQGSAGPTSGIRQSPVRVKVWSNRMDASICARIHGAAVISPRAMRLRQGGSFERVGGQLVEEHAHQLRRFFVGNPPQRCHHGPRAGEVETLAAAWPRLRPECNWPSPVSHALSGSSPVPCRGDQSTKHLSR